LSLYYKDDILIGGAGDDTLTGAGGKITAQGVLT
jgi:Ca2+-binding RTX toxin-like protein